MAKIDLDFFEKVILYHCLKQDGIFLAKTIDYLDKKLFKNKNIAQIVDVIRNFNYENDAVPSIIELKTRLNTQDLKESFKSAVESIKGLDSNYNELELINNTEYFLKQRNYQKFIEETIEQQVSTKEIDSELIQKEVERINSISLIDNFGLDYFGDKERVIQYLTEEDIFISTGYEGLDAAFGGGLFREGRAFYNIGGETNVGKSIVLANVAANVLLQNLNVVIFTFEMSEKRYAKRMSSILSKIALKNLKDEIDNFREYIDDFISKYTSNLVIKEFPAKSVSAKQLNAFLKSIKKKKGFKPDLLIFDYHALLKPSVKQSAKYEDIQYITQECRGLTYAFEAPGLSVAQLNRNSHKAHNPGLDNISGSWDSVSDLDGMVNLSQTDEDRENSLLRFTGCKNRDGKKNVSGAFIIDYDTLRLTELKEDDDFQEPSITDEDIKNIQHDISDLL